VNARPEITTTSATRRPRLWDISQRLHSRLPVWPGDTAFEQQQTAQIGGDCVVNINRFAMSTQAGTHAEAPLHFQRDGRSIDALPLDRFVGRCVVIQVANADRFVQPDDVLPHLPPGATRVLLRTLGDFTWDRWPEGFPAIHADTIHALAARGVELIGTDAPSLDPQTSKELHAHHAVGEHGLVILEGLVLKDVAAGPYELIALPLPIEGVEAAPVRAILRELA